MMSTICFASYVTLSTKQCHRQTGFLAPSTTVLTPASRLTISKRCQPPRPSASRPSIHTLHSCAPSPAAADERNDEKSNDEYTQLAAAIDDYLSNPFTPDDGPLSFVMLERLNRKDLMARILACGGSQAVAARLQIDDTLFLPPLKPQASKVAAQFYKPDTGATLALGSDLEARLNTIDDVMAEPRNELLGSDQDRVRRRTGVDSVPSGDEVRQQLETATLDGKAGYTAPLPPPLGESLALPLDLRLGIVVLAAVSALGFGHASTSILNPTTISACQYVALSFLVAHAGLAVYTALFAAPGLGRDPSIWFVKVLLSGPLAVRSLRALGPLSDD